MVDLSVMSSINQPIYLFSIFGHHFIPKQVTFESNNLAIVLIFIPESTTFLQENLILCLHILNFKWQAVLKYVSKKFYRKFIWRVGRAYLIHFEKYLA